MEYIKYTLNCRQEEMEDLYYLHNTGKVRSSVWNMFLPERFNNDTSNKEQ